MDKHIWKTNFKKKHNVTAKHDEYMRGKQNIKNREKNQILQE